MICPVCGTPCDDNTSFCPACGSPISVSVPETAPVSEEFGGLSNAPVSSTVVSSTPSISANSAVSYVKQYMGFIALAIAAIGLILAIFNFGGQFDISATVTYGSQSETASGPVAEVIESGEKPMILIGNLLFGFANLAIAGIGALLFLKEYKKLPYYDNFIAKFVKFNPLFLMGGIGAGAGVLQILCYLISGESRSIFGTTISYSFGVNWTTWVFLFFYAGIAAADMLVLRKASVEDPAN